MLAMRIEITGDRVRPIYESAEDNRSMLLCCENCGRFWQFLPDSGVTVATKKQHDRRRDQDMRISGKFCHGCHPELFVNADELAAEGRLIGRFPVPEGAVK